MTSRRWLGPGTSCPASDRTKTESMDRRNGMNVYIISGHTSMDGNEMKRDLASDADKYLTRDACRSRDGVGERCHAECERELSRFSSEE